MATTFTVGAFCDVYNCCIPEAIKILYQLHLLQY